MVDGMPQPLLDAAREPFAAQAVIYVLLLSRDDEATRSRQLQLLQGQIEPPLFQQTQQLAAVAQSLAAAARLPLVDLAIPALKRSSPSSTRNSARSSRRWWHADGKVDLFEYCLRTVLFSYLDVHFGLKKPPAIRYRTTAAVAQPATVVLSMLAYVGQNRPEDVQRAFQAGAQGSAGASRSLAAPASNVRCAPSTPRWPSWPKPARGQTGRDRRGDRLHRRRRQSDVGGKRAIAGGRRRAGLSRAAARRRDFVEALISPLSHPARFQKPAGRRQPPYRPAFHSEEGVRLRLYGTPPPTSRLRDYRCEISEPRC